MYWNFGNVFYVFSVWPEAADIDSTAYGALMNSANALAVAYAPALPLGDPVPDNYKLAEIYFARDIWSQQNAGNADSIGHDGLTIPVMRFSYLAQDLLRPKTLPLKRLR
ncbi:hypothetical protein [Arthrobacter sp. B2a2-09]|uniref:hypothetical protein n=1 Tax=Arthrobacter sp. B2a2-09 TaxID=2952822 RepID=UPI0022CD9C50|nr:hypothetical protein [Arthrobacter sp. B2a2-09]MCZ9883716.1 hypothetical protein [Arthrobacter sp. B2a2-09]